MKFKKYEVKLPIDLWDKWCRSLNHSKTINNFIMHGLITNSGNITEFYNIFSKIAGTTVIVKTELDSKTFHYFNQYTHGYCVYYNDSKYPMLNLPIPITCIENYTQLKNI